MITDEYIELVEKLLGKTQCSEVNWLPTSANGEFVVYFNDFSLSISGGHNPNDEQYVRVVLRNDNGAEIDSFWSVESEREWELISELLSGARRKALNIDEAISTILTELDSVGTVGKKEDPIDDVPF